MKIHLYCILRNEAKILPYFFRHYRQFVTIFFMYDDNSDDGSRKIIQEEPRAVLLNPPSTGLDDCMFSDLHSNRYREYSLEADWVICVDADEFLWAPHMSDELLKETCNPEHKILRCEGYQMMAEKFPTTPGQIYDEVRKGIYDPRYTKCIMFRPSIDITYGAGRHDYRSAVRHSDCAFRNLHFRYLSEEYVQQKHAQNFSRLTDENRSHGFGLHNSPDYEGQYDIFWYRQTLKEAKPCLD